MNGFAPNLIQTPRIRSLGKFYHQNSYPTKSNMAAAANAGPEVVITEEWMFEFYRRRRCSSRRQWWSREK